MGVYFATASRDRTARLWSTDRTTALRIYAGHLSDIDVGSSSLLRRFVIKDSGSAWISTRTRYIWRRDRVIGLPDYGMSNVGRA